MRIGDYLQRITNGSAQTAWAAATSQTGQLAELSALWSGDVEIRGYSLAGTLLTTLTYSGWNTDTSEATYFLSLDTLTDESLAVNDVVRYCKAFIPGGVEVVAWDISPVVSSDLSKIAVNGLRINATASLPATSTPTWRTAMTTLTWAEIPGNTLSAIDPAANAAINPNGTSGAPWAGTDGQTCVGGYAWNGGTYDHATDTMHLPLQGGHANYAGNEPYSCALDASADWVMLRNPSGAIGNTITLNDGQEATGLYSDGRLRSTHSYSNLCYVPGHGPIITRPMAFYSSGGGVLYKMFLVSESTGEASEWADYSALSYPDPVGTTNEGAACYDSTRACVWHLGGGTAKMLKTLVSTRVTTAHGTYGNHINDGGGSLVYMPALDLVAALKSYDNTFKIFDPTSDTWTAPTVSGSYATGYDGTDSAAGIDWDEANQRLLLWNQSSNTTLITILTPPGSSPATNAWTASTMSVDGGNTVTPGTRQGPGTFGRFKYSPNLKGCVLLCSNTTPLYFFATEAL